MTLIERIELSPGFEAEQDGDTFTIRFPDGHAITAWADGRLAITKAFSGYFPFDVHVSSIINLENHHYG